MCFFYLFSWNIAYPLYFTLIIYACVYLFFLFVRKWLPPPLRKLSQGKLNSGDGGGKNVPVLKKTSSDKKLKVRTKINCFLSFLHHTFTLHAILSSTYTPTHKISCVQYIFIKLACVCGVVCMFSVK